MNTCPKCGKEVFIVITSKGNGLPVDYDSLGQEDLIKLKLNKTIKFRPAIHISHYGTCKHQSNFNKKFITKKF